MSSFTRRNLLKAGMAGSLAMPFIMSAGKSYAQGEVNVLAYNKHFPQEFIDRFQNDTGVSVNLRITDEQDKVFNLFSVERPNYSNDVVIASGTRLKQFSSNDFIEPIDTGRLTGWKNLAPAYADAPNLRIDGNVVGVPTLVLGQILGFNSERVEYADSWEIIFDPKYAKKTVWKVADILQTVIKIQGHSAALTEFLNDEVGAQAAIDKAKDFLIENKGRVLKFYEADAEVQQIMVNEDAYVANMTSGPAARLIMGGYPIKMAIPKEGCLFSVYNATIAKNAKNKDNAYKFLDAFLNDPAVGGAIAKDAGFISTLKDAGAGLSEAERAAVTIDENHASRIEWFDVSNYDMVSPMFSKAIAEINAA